MPTEIKDFLSTLPTAWDEPKLLSGYPGVDAIIARRKGNTWYIGGLNGTDEARTLSFTTTSLSNLGKTITIFKDGADNRNFDIEKAIPSMNVNEKIDIECLPRGGFVAQIF